MQLVNTLLAIFLTSSVVCASPLGRLSHEKRQAGNVVWVTVTSIETITVHTHTGYYPQFTKTVTFHHTLVDPPQRVAPEANSAPIVETPVPAPAPVAPETPMAAVETPAIQETPPQVAVSPTTPVASSPTPYVPATTPTVAAAAANSEDTTSTSGTVYSGQGTYYSTGLGSCGVTSHDSDYICAISHILYDSVPDGGNPNNSPFCGKQIKAFRNGQSVTVTVMDRCQGCAEYDLDFSPSSFDQLAASTEGRVDITWEWV